jgi:hypothetical protein
MSISKSFVVKNGLEVSNNLLVANSQTNKVGIGSSNPKFDLEVAGGIGATSSYIFGISTVAGTLNVGQRGNTLTAGSGLVGIGTANPQFLLDIKSPVSTGQTALYVRGDVFIEPPGSLNVGISSITSLNAVNINSSGIVTTTTLDLNGQLVDSFSNSTGTLGQYLKSTGTGVKWESFGVYRNRQTFISTEGQIDYSFLFENQYLDVYLNGVKLAPTTDYTPILNLSAYSGNTVRLINPAFSGDVVEITSFINSGDLAIIDGATINVLSNGAVVGVATGLNFGTGLSVSTSALGVPGIATIRISAAPTIQIGSTNTSQVTYPTFVTGIGSTSLYINSSNFSFIPSSGKLGVGTPLPQRTLEVSGDIAFSNQLYAVTPSKIVSTNTGTLNGNNRNFIGVNTSGLIVGYGVTETTGIGLVQADTLITSIGIGSIGISKLHGQLVGTSTTSLTFYIPTQLSPGSSSQVLVSSGPNQPTSWQDAASFININVQDKNDNQTYYPIFSPVNSGITTLAVNADGLVFNPLTNSLGIGSTSPKTQLDVVGNVSAINYFGNGSALSGIVTQITAGIGISLTPTSGQGNVTIDAYRPTGKTIYVKQNGDDNNSGLSENYAKRTIKAAANVAVYGDTIKVYPGVYVEQNPIVLKKTVSVQGTELRNCVVTPMYPYSDLFYVNNGCHITNISFIGPDMTDGAAVVALQKLQGVSVDRFFDAARMIRYNLDFIANETVGYISSTSYQNPAVSIATTDYINYIKSAYLAICHDITRGGNSKCVGFASSFYTGGIINVGIGTTTIDAFNYSFNIARAVVNNSTWGGSPVGIATTVSSAVYNNTTGITTITASNHGLSKNDAVRIVGLGFTCSSGPGIVTYPSGAYGYIFNVLNVIDGNNFNVVVGQSTLPHTYVSGGTVQKYTNFQNTFGQVKDLGIQVDLATGFNNAVTGCTNVISAINSCVGVVTTIIKQGPGVVGSSFNRTYPGNSGIGFTTVSGITSAVYNEQTGKVTIKATGLKAIQGEAIELRDLSFSCSSGGGISTQTFPSGRYGYDFFIDKLNNDGSVEVYVGASTLPHTYVGGGSIINRTVGITSAVYVNTTGITTIKAPGLSIKTGDLVRIRGLQFSCSSGAATTTIYPTGNNGYDFRVLDIVTDKPVAVTSAVYNNTSGITTITAPGIGVTTNGIVELKNLQFSCSSGAATTTLYPTGNNGYKFKVISSIGSTFTVNVGPSTIPHTYVSGGTAINRTLTANDTFTINVGPSTIPHTYVSGGIAIPPFSRGVGPITQGPYVRNCTNFIPKSIGMKVDGFEAEPGDQLDIGVTGTMSVDSYTQYNQGGIGVSITNGAYAQLVSIFTICDDIAIYTGSGGQCDITNSNSSFGRIGLFSDGVGNQNTKSVYHYTGVANTSASAKTNTITISGVGTNRPYDGQVCYFGDLYYFIDTVQVTNGGSGYSVSPTVSFSTPEGANGITAQATATVQNGSVTSINIVNSGTQYKKPPIITIAGPTGAGTTATAVVSTIQPIYYKVTSATLPSSGISTVTFLQTLNNDVGTGTTVYFYRGSLQLATTISFEYVGAGTNINTAKPALGGVVIPENQVVQKNGGIVVYTSTDQSGNFKIGDGVVINQATGQISGRDFTKALFTTMTPFILALSE